MHGGNDPVCDPSLWERTSLPAWSPMDLVDCLDACRARRGAAAGLSECFVLLKALDAADQPLAFELHEAALQRRYGGRMLTTSLLFSSDGVAVAESTGLLEAQLKVWFSAAGLVPCRRTRAFSTPAFLLGALLVVLLVPTVAWVDCARRTRRTLDKRRRARVGFPSMMGWDVRPNRAAARAAREFELAERREEAAVAAAVAAAVSRSGVAREMVPPSPAPSLD